ncbi:hypothetical protein [Kangiella sp. TOML190]|uniref:hypothetical protein n=1 Tax=Kangiella sp. TOML190 TaxID=2931351 RepID=UPI0020403335|nr:hypothetical protein [Kangiella sp. TOML190]
MTESATIKCIQKQLLAGFTFAGQGVGSNGKSLSQKISAAQQEKDKSIIGALESQGRRALELDYGAATRNIPDSLLFASTNDDQVMDEYIELCKIDREWLIRSKKSMILFLKT